MLKADLHIHTNEDPKHPDIKYSPKQLIDQAAKDGYDVIALTYHDKVAEINSELNVYAKKRNIILISGIERTIDKSHVLIYNITKIQAQKINSFQDLNQLKQKNNKIFVIAPHPFHIGETCLRNKLEQHLSLFDALEYSWFYTKLINLNHKVKCFASKKNLPLVGNSDLHRLDAFGTTYTLIDAQKNKNSIFSAIKANKVKVISTPIPLFKFIKIALRLIIEHFVHSLQKRFKK